MNIRLKICTHCQDAPAAYLLFVKVPGDAHLKDICAWCAVAGIARLKERRAEGTDPLPGATVQCFPFLGAR